jgi:hypothetical protein
MLTHNQWETFNSRFGSKAKSLCSCGHTGDGEGGDHGDTLAFGHGPCLVPGCSCRHFTWVKWLPEVETFLKEAIAENGEC